MILSSANIVGENNILSIQLNLLLKLLKIRAVNNALIIIQKSLLSQQKSQSKRKIQLPPLIFSKSLVLFVA